MKRNLVLIHLESLSLLNYRMNPQFYPNIRELERQSISFSNYYATATSTLMVISDIAYGRESHNESIKTIIWDNSVSKVEHSFLDEMIDQGYDVSVLAYPYTGPDIESMNNNHFLGKKIRMEVFDDLDLYHEKLSERTNVKKPFVLWACNFISNVDNNCRISKEKCGIQRWEDGHRKLDFEVGFILNLLKRREILNNTTIVVYGDHGDDFYSHGYHMGLIHAIEPYEQIIHTPLIIYDSRFRPYSESLLICSLGIRKLIRKSLADSFFYRDLNFSDILCDAVFSRNMYAAQKVRDNSFEKGYCVTDGEYMLLVNSKGLSMYATKMDPTCQNNLLNLICLRNGELVANNEMLEVMYYHFKHIFDKETVDGIIKKYAELLEILKKKVKDIYEKGGCLERLYEMNFELVNNNVILDDDKNFDLFEPYFTGRRVAIYGAGKYGRYCIKRIKDKCTIVGIFDKDYNNIEKVCGIKPVSPDLIDDKLFDVLYIAITESRSYQEVYEFLIRKGINKRKLL